MDLREFLIRLVVAMEDLLVVIGGLGVNRGIRLGIRRRSSCGDTSEILLNLWSLGEIVVDSKPLSVELILHAQEISSVVYIVTWGCKIWTSLDRSLCDVKIEALISKSHNLSIVNHLILFFVSFLVLDHTSENHNFLSGDLCSSSMNNPEFEVVCDVVDGLPNILFDIKCFHFLDIVKSKFPANASLWLEALSTNNEDVLLVELANTEGLSWLLEAWEQNPLLA